MPLSPNLISQLIGSPWKKFRSNLFEIILLQSDLISARNVRVNSLCIDWGLSVRWELFFCILHRRFSIRLFALNFSAWKVFINEDFSKIFPFSSYPLTRAFNMFDGHIMYRGKAAPHLVFFKKLSSSNEKKTKNLIDL